MKNTFFLFSMVWSEPSLGHGVVVVKAELTGSVTGIASPHLTLETGKTLLISYPVSF